ncbi:hypothetical protein AEP_01592 [Curvibacter sp. AEP1-3]|uniref:tyrosine-type recombinase/integrase n=1 Tax=Curvibacter sp. AEP1-3 TaxID=1844971 RepID=UPI000B3C6FB2|nr:tyrosine-type recombinase/integrase [Curvibacter sp. AEP1-3]ARV18536.1 hypothetical protein AEP_01592 [Curvibacter sp. AEP1-3]
MNLMHKIAGNTVAAWDDLNPLRWTMTESKPDDSGKDAKNRNLKFDFDLSSLSDGYDLQFLLNLKMLLIEHHKRVQLSTLKSYAFGIEKVLAAMKVPPPAALVTKIDRIWLGRLRLLKDDISPEYLSDLKVIFNAHRDGPIFSSDLVPADFPLKNTVKGKFGQRIDNILKGVLTRAAQVAVLKAAEEAYEIGSIDLPKFAFLHTAFHVYVRTSTYCRLTVSDLIVDENPISGDTKYFLALQLRKTGIEPPIKELREIHEELGKILISLRAHVIERHRHLFTKNRDESKAPNQPGTNAPWTEIEIGKLALFPAPGLDSNGMFKSAHSRNHYGECTVASLHESYLEKIVRLTGSAKFHFTGLRHTVGTQLATAGLSAQQIAAVLKHVASTTCHAYVDIVFQGLIDQLSDSIEPAAREHFPVAFRSKLDSVKPEKAIRSIDETTGKVELNGECGRDLACQYAPLVCYGCHRFIPSYDAEHEINLHRIDAEIEEYKQRGLPFNHMVERAKDCRRYIALTIAACQLKRNAINEEQVAGRKE